MTERFAPIIAFTSFWRGFVTPSWVALCLTIITCAVTGVLVFSLFTPTRLAGPLGAYLPRSTHDTEGFATRDALALSRNSASSSRLPALYVIGDSIMAHMFASDVLTARALRAVTGQSWHVSFLTTPLQGELDEATLADYATRMQPGVVVLALSIDRFDEQPASLIELYWMGRLGLRSDWADQDVAMLGGQLRKRTGIYAVDNGQFLLRNVASMVIHMIFGKGPVRRIDDFVPSRGFDPKSLEDQREAMLRALRNPMHSNSLGIRLLAETVRRLRARGTKVVFVEQELNAKLFNESVDRSKYEEYLQNSPAIAKALGGAYCRLGKFYRPAPAAFADYIHIINKVSQDELRRALAICVAGALSTGGRS